MTQFGLSGVTEVDLSQFWPAWHAIDSERDLVNYYAAARDFWRDYDLKLTMSRDRVTELRRDMELYTNWTALDRLGRPKPEAASTAFYNRIDAGSRSVQQWLNGGTATVRDRFNDLAARLPTDLQMADMNRETLLAQDKVTDTTTNRGPIASFTTAKITEGDGKVFVPVLRAEAVRTAVEDTVRRRDELMVLFRQITDDLARLPDDVTWAGPTTVAPATPPGGNPDTGPGGGPGAAPGGGGPGGGPAGTAPGGGPTGAAPGGGPTAATADMPGDPGATPDTGLPETMSAPATESGLDTGELPGGPVIDPATGEPIATLPTSDPALAGTPSATLSPTAPPTPLSSNVPSSHLGVPGPSPSGGGNPLGPTTFPLTQTGGPPAYRGSGAGQPSPGSTVDGPRVAPGAGEAPRGGPTGAGFYPPPMVPPMGGMAGRGGIKPGEADFAGGAVRRAGGRDSWRAGLRPQLLGRAGEYDDDQYQAPSACPVSGGEVLDEELWQVPDAAPATPPEPPRHNHPWGPG
jgi:hypothetical protein